MEEGVDVICSKPPLYKVSITDKARVDEKQESESKRVNGYF